MGTRNRPLTVRLEAKEFEALSREARTMHLTDSAYVRLLIERGRDRMFLQHVANELKDLRTVEAREAQFVALGSVAEIRALVRAMAIQTIGLGTVRKEQEGIIPTVREWRERLKVPERGRG